MYILAAQINSIIGDLKGNTQKIIQAIERGRAKGADIVLFPELALSGYPPEDFLLIPDFLLSVQQNLDEIIQASQGICVIVGLPRPNPDKYEKLLYNSAAVIENQKLLGYVDKILLPTYDVFDEKRYFESGGKPTIWKIKDKKIAITICEDLWQHSGFVKTTHYLRDPVLEIKELTPDLILNLSASPYSFDKLQMRYNVCLEAAKTVGCPILLCNLVGGNDSLIFDGHSMAVNKDGVILKTKGFVEEDLWFDSDKPTKQLQLKEDSIANLYQALVMGLRDYFFKQGFKKACLGLSGGIDSALVACIAADALGPENVLALYMPSRFSADESCQDAKQLAKNLGIELRELPIESPFESYLGLFAKDFAGKPLDTTEENLQARIRGMILMAYSNKFGYLVLSTGNKSEIALGYCTLYGDMCGGLAVIGDLTKNQVYTLAKWINRDKVTIPPYTIERAPSAELRPNQKDSDTLPPYDMLDKVLQSYIEDHLSPELIAKKYAFPLSVVKDLVKKIHQNEYKRRQMAPSLRVSEKAFSIGRRFPIVQKWV